MSAKIEERVEEIVRGLLTTVPELELVDVEYVRERDYYLRVYIDKEGGIDIDDCQALSERLEEILDREDFIPDAYILEVSSPGIDRVLRKPRDFERERGKQVDVTLYAPFDGKKQWTGALMARRTRNCCKGAEFLQDIFQNLVLFHNDLLFFCKKRTKQSNH